MANYFNLTLDTTAPSGVSVSINNGDNYTTSRNVTLSIGCSDESTTGYSMKIWGFTGKEDESDASWETFQASKQVQLTTGDGQKTIYVKIRDDVYNESVIVSDTIVLNTTVPQVTVSGIDVNRISKVADKNTCTFNFSSDTAFAEYKVKVVPSQNSLHDAGTLIGTANGSENMSGSGAYSRTQTITSKIKGSDLEAASAGDGQKIIKVFVKTSVGIWSM